MLIGPQNSTLHVNHVRSRIRQAAIAAGRDPAAVTLVAVTKAQTAETIRVGRHRRRHGFRRKLSSGGTAPRWTRWPTSTLHLALHRRHPVQQDPRHRRALRLGAQHRSAAASPGACRSSGPSTRRRSTSASKWSWCRSRTRAASSRPRSPSSRPPSRSCRGVRLRGLMCVPPPQPDAAAERGAVRDACARLLEELNAERPRARYTVDGDERRLRGRHCRGRDAGPHRHGAVRAPRVSTGRGISGLA